MTLHVADRRRWVATLAFIAVATFAPEARRIDPLVYTIRFPDPASRTFTVELIVPTGKLVEAGLTPLAALQAATRNPARVLGLADSLGRIEPGKLADLVLLDANPSRTSATRRRSAPSLPTAGYIAARPRPASG